MPSAPATLPLPGGRLCTWSGAKALGLRLSTTLLNPPFAMPATLSELLLATKLAGARHEATYAVLSQLPSHNPEAPEWQPVWSQLRELREALEAANNTYLAAVRAENEARREARYAVSYVAEAA